MATSCGDLAAQGVIALDIGLRLALQGQRLRGIQRRLTDGLTVDQSVQDIQHMRLGRHTLGQRKFHSGQHSLLIVVQDKRKDIDHLAVAAGLAQHVLLQLPEGGR